MMAAESSANPSTDDNNTTTILDTKKSKVSSILSPLSFSSTSSAASLSISSQQQQQHQQEQEQQQQQQSSQSVPNDRSSITTISSPSLTTTNVFINFPSSCCCRQMMATAKTARTRITAATSATTTTIAAGNSSSNSNCKKSIKNGSDSRISGIGGGPSPFRQLLPIALCILSFATVLSILIVYMDTTEIRHQQFRLNMSRDYELHGVSQDNPTLIAFLREIHMKKYPMNFLKNARVEHLNFTEHHGELTPEMANYISSLVGGKMNGAFIQSMTGSTGNVMTGPWLAETLNWSGLLVEPEPRRYFTLRKQNVHRPKVQVVHACVSPSGYPKEVRIHNEDSEVRINSLLDEETSWFNTRVKCFPLYTLMLAINRVDYDLLSLGCEDHELEILQTLPFDKVNVEVISIHLTENNENVTKYVRNISKFLLGKSYKLQRRFDNNYIYQKINSNRTKKQIKSISSIVAATTATTTPTKTSTTTTTTAASIAITGTSTTTMTSLIKMQESQQKQHYDKHKRQN